jgi:hypothetical protein
MTQQKLRFAYLRDPEEPQRVVTLGWVIKTIQDLEHPEYEQQWIWYQYAINKIVPKEKTRLNERIRPFLGNELFKATQKRLLKRYGGDQHCKKRARAIVQGKFESGYSTKHTQGNHAIKEIVAHLASQHEHPHQDLAVRILSEVIRREKDESQSQQ